MARLRSGLGDEDDVRKVKLLTDRCGRFGCAYGRMSRSSPGFAECPGWCDALQAHRKAAEERERALAGEAGARPRALVPRERRAIGKLEAGEELAYGDLLALELLCATCRGDGCPHAPAKEGEGKEASAKPCPGWCAVAERAWRARWQR